MQPPGDANRILGDVVVLYEDNHLLVVNKPAGLLSQGAAKDDDNLVARAKGYLKIRYAKPGKVFVGCVHRLDRNVSGVIVLARTSKAAARLSKAFASRDVEKRYLAVVEGRTPLAETLEHRLAPKPEGRGVVAHPSGKLARLSFELVSFSSRRSLLTVALETGRKHQIRAQLAFAGWPIVGDPLYGSAAHDRIRRPALHACSLTFSHPVRREDMRFQAEIPADLERLLAREKFDRSRMRVFS